MKKEKDSMDGIKICLNCVYRKKCRHRPPRGSKKERTEFCSSFSIDKVTVATKYGGALKPLMSGSFGDDMTTRRLGPIDELLELREAIGKTIAEIREDLAAGKKTEG